VNAVAAGVDAANRAAAPIRTTMVNRARCIHQLYRKNATGLLTKAHPMAELALGCFAVQNYSQTGAAAQKKNVPRHTPHKDHEFEFLCEHVRYVEQNAKQS